MKEYVVEFNKNIYTFEANNKIEAMQMFIDNIPQMYPIHKKQLKSCTKVTVRNKGKKDEAGYK